MEKTKLRKKLEKAWVLYVIDISVGPYLMMISMREPERANKLSEIMVRAIHDLYKQQRLEIVGHPETFQKMAANICIELLHAFMNRRLTLLLIEGMPKPSNIITSGRMPTKEM